MLTTLAMTPQCLHADDQIPGRGVVTTTTPHGDHVIVQFTNGNAARYLPDQHLTIHRPT
ncbi:MAG: hypothetical protein ABIQ18_46835 [Umezawaea sp.]